MENQQKKSIYSIISHITHTIYCVIRTTILAFVKLKKRQKMKNNEVKYKILYFFREK